MDLNNLCAGVRVGVRVVAGHGVIEHNRVQGAGRLFLILGFVENVRFVFLVRKSGFLQ